MSGACRRMKSTSHSTRAHYFRFFGGDSSTPLVCFHIRRSKNRAEEHGTTTAVCESASPLCNLASCHRQFVSASYLLLLLLLLSTRLVCAAATLSVASTRRTRLLRQLALLLLLLLRLGLCDDFCPL